MSTIAFICGLVLMLVAYILLSLLGSALLSYMIKRAHQALQGSFSLSARLRRQWFNFGYKKERLTTDHQNQSNYLRQKTDHSRHSLHDNNTKKHIRTLAKQTRQQLYKQRKKMHPEIRKSTHLAIRRCVNQLDMYGLIEINFRISNTLDTIPNSAGQHKIQ